MNMVVNEKPLSPAEQGRLSELEVLIKENFQAYVEVGKALLEIREKRLYRNYDGRTWERYCRELWDMSYRRADQLIAAKSVAENLRTIVLKNDGSPDWEFFPTSESQARELVGLAPDEQRNVWRDLIECKQAAVNKGKPFRLTAKAIRTAVKKYKGDKIVKHADKAAELVTNPSSRSNYKNPNSLRRPLNSL